MMELGEGCQKLWALSKARRLCRKYRLPGPLRRSQGDPLRDGGLASLAESGPALVGREDAGIAAW